MNRSSAALAGAVMLALSLLPGGCDFDGKASVAGVDSGMIPPDASDRPDANEVDIDGGPVAPANHLLISEVKPQPDAAEFIEIFNPLDEDVVLTDYYLTDVPTYYLLPGYADSPPNLDNFDAILRFPPGSVIAAGGVVVIARDDVTFAQAFSDQVADFAVKASDEVQAMIQVAYGSRQDMDINHKGNVVTLFTWDGMTDLVSDVDMVVVGEAPMAGYELSQKTGVEIDGPDDDEATTAYQDDAGTMLPMDPRDHSTYERIAFEDEYEIFTNGNGVSGHDETSEDTSQTWEQVLDNPPTPGRLAPTLR